jgi:hypothetical protein
MRLAMYVSMDHYIGRPEYWAAEVLGGRALTEASDALVSNH